MALPRIVVTRILYGPIATLSTLERIPAGELLPDLRILALEPPGWPWVPENAVNRARIPTGTYRAVVGIHHGSNDDPTDDYPCIEYLDVPGRSEIEIHRGNRPRETKGCQLAGTRFGLLEHRPAVLDSATAFANLMAPFSLGDELVVVVADATA